MQGRAAVPRLRWAAPGAALYVGLVALLMAVNLTKLSRGPAIGDLAWLGVAVLVAVWALELVGVPWPRVVLAGVTAVIVGYLVRTFDNGLPPLFLLLLVIWVSYTASRRDSYVALGLSLATLVPFWAQFDISVPWTIGIVSMWFGIQALLAQRRTLVQLRAAQADLATQAAAAERQRIAREIHDVIAHSLAVTLLHLTGARHILQRDPRRAEQALAQAEQLGRQSLADVRRTVGLLQTAGTSASPAGPVLAPLPTATDIRTLVDEYAGAGMRVQLAMLGDTCQLSAGVGLALYRIAQEALANVAKHATTATAHVELIVDDGQGVVQLRVRDSGGIATLRSRGQSEPGTGMGVPGMRKRAELLGGSLSAGPDPSGRGWMVLCTLPAALRYETGIGWTE